MLYEFAFFYIRELIVSFYLVLNIRLSLSTFTGISSLNPPNNLRGRYSYHPHFIEEDEALMST